MADNLWLGFEQPKEGDVTMCPNCNWQGCLRWVNLDGEEGAFWSCDACSFEIYEWNGYDTKTVHVPTPTRTNQ